jgi:hypothetical protein
MDSKYVLTGGEDDLVQVWSMEDHAVVAWGEGHNSWVTPLPVCQKIFHYLIYGDKR